MSSRIHENKEHISSWWLIGCSIVFVLFRVASAPTANIAFLLIAGYALFGYQQAILALAFSWLFTMLNPALAPEATFASIGRYLVISAAAISVTWRTMGSGERLSVNKISFITFCLSVLMLLHSLLFSAVVEVSVLKVFSWVVVVLTLLSAWQGLGVIQRSVLFNQLQWGLMCLMLLSLPLLAFPDIGYLRNGTGFQGVLNHPQAFGPIVALVGVLLGGRIMGQRKPSWRDMALFGMSLVLVFLSEARTAGAALLLGLLASALLSPKFAGVPRNLMLPGLRSRRFNVVVLIALVGVIVGSPFFSSKLSSFLFKRSDATSLAAAAEASRGVLVEKMVANIQREPLTGIGFGIASEPANMEIERDPFLGLPLSALVEKGVMPVALVEELGVFGSLAVLGWFLMMLRRGARSGVSQFAVVISVLLVNFGESMFFSVGGMGMLLLILLTGAVTVQQTAERQVARV